VAECVRAGADVVSFSGDKLFGGPQAGIIVGKKEYLDRMKRNPLLRAIRIDKLTLAALEAVLHIHLRGEAAAKLPTLRMLAAPLPRLAATAERLAAAIGKTWGDRGTVAVIDGSSQAGGGSLPGKAIPTKLVAITPMDRSVNQLETQLRCNNPPILVRIGQGRLLIDPRTLLAGDIEIITDAFGKAAENGGGKI
jgi:L-seryl-tRNA(Ser) seleniumtransferase